ncbi:unnamed protein product [Prorocentrum cordatum]|uniref:Uncharacterized protein n=1 Tax=Prorocentrum cordatum TaxID=2364126 RepID=A0ABN9SZ25_9DINO|nr:unnamed protein product [Polarella glacialis]
MSMRSVGSLSLSISCVRSHRILGRTQDANYLLCVVMYIVTCIITCIGDILEYFISWAHVKSAWFTYSMVKLSNSGFIITDLLDSIQGVGAFMCALFGAVASVGAVFLIPAGNVPTRVAAGICGFLTGPLAGSVAPAFRTSCAEALPMCWADAPHSLRASHQVVYSEFEKRVHQMD